MAEQVETKRVRGKSKAKYVVRMTNGDDGGAERFSSANLDECRQWIKGNGVPGGKYVVSKVALTMEVEAVTVKKFTVLEDAEI